MTTGFRSTDIIFRWGGEEFLIVAQETALKEALELAEDIRQGVAEKDFSVAKQVTISV